MRFISILLLLSFSTQLIALETKFINLKRSPKELLRISTWKMEITGANQSLKGIYHGQVIITLTCKNNTPESILSINGELTGMKANDEILTYKKCKSLSDEIWFKGHNVARPIYVLLQKNPNCKNNENCDHIIKYIGNTKP